MGVAIITLSGVNRAYEAEENDSIFSGVVLPEGIDAETLYNRILFRAGEFSVMYDDIYFIHNEILNFFKCHYFTFDRWIKALNKEYDPLENYNRTETYMGGNSHADQNSSQTSGSSSGTTTYTKTGYNSSNFNNYDQTSNSTSDSGSLSGSNSGSFNEQHTLKAFGNIGVTTSQQMLEAELKVAEFSIYDRIADMLVSQICIMVY